LEPPDAADADILIFPSYIEMGKAMALLPDEHPLKGASREEVAAAMAQKYLRVKSDLMAQVDDFWSEQFSGKERVVTVHIRGGDKYQESMMPRFSRYKDEVKHYLARYPEAGIFLATDSSAAVDYFEKCFGERVVTVPVLRSSGRQGVHKMGADGLQIGREILFDVECLSRGNHFIGFDESNVYFWVCHMTERGWKKRFSDVSVRSGWKEVFTSRQSLKSALKSFRKHGRFF
jgi:hypothetical protein